MKRVLSVFIALVIAFTTVAPGAVTVYAESSDAIVTDSNEIYEEQSEEESEEITNSASINSEGQEEQGTETSVEKPESENKLEETTQNQEYVSDRNHDQNSNSEYNEKEPASRPKEDDVIEVNEAETELVSQPAMNSLVEDAIVEGSDEGTGISWAISNTENGLTLTLASDSGELDTIPWDYDVLEQYFNQITCVEICSGVTTIGYNLLSGMESLSVVRLPDGLKEIRGYAFSNCSKISNIEIPNTVTTIGSYAFSDCEKLTDVSLSEGLISIENNAFYNCASIAELIIPKTVTNLGGEFIAGTKIQTIEIPASVEYADSALSGAMYLDRVEFSDGTIKIPSNLFGTDPGKYNYVKEIRVPEGVTTIGSYAFYNLDQLKNVTLPASLSQIEYCAFAESSMLESVTFTENDTYVRTDYAEEKTMPKFFGFA
ncbi:MAG: leucine-rich repeat domain-containing protein [Eubacterium sp.]|nr:leucine-rich repeat domain-containing protein [Eubacterium sp.]